MREPESRTRRKLERIEGLALAATLLYASSLGAQPVIEHDDVDCLPRGEFTQFLASIQPASTIRAAKLYFRSNLYPEFYFVAMSLDAAGSFEAVMPRPAAETTRVVYYIEAVDLSFQTSRSEELEASISDDPGCRRGPGAVLFPGGSPAIVVGATQAGLPSIPVGFQATGITGFFTASGGIASSGGGGIGIGVAVGAAAGAAAGVGVLIAGGGGSDGASLSTTTSLSPLGGGSTTSTSTPTSTIAMTTTSSAVSTTTSPGGPSTTTSPSGPSTTTSPSGPSTTTSPSGPSTTTTSGPSTSTIPTTTIAPSTTTTAAPSPLTACFEWQPRGDCLVDFDSCSTPETLIQIYEWRMLGPPVPEPPQTESFRFDFEGDPRCLGTMSFNYPVRLTVFDSLGRSDSVQQNVSVQPGLAYRTDDGTSTILSFKSQLAALPPDGSVRGRIAVNGAAIPPLDNAAASRHEVRVGAGIVRIEVTLLTPAPPGSFWELDFSSSESLVAGSLKPEAGVAVRNGENRIVFRLNGDRGETFRLRLSVR